MSMVAEFTFPADWEQHHHDTMDEATSVSNEEASKVFSQWQTANLDDLDIMEVDQQINLLEDDLFHDPCMSPTGPLEELVSMQLDESDAPFLDFFEENKQTTDGTDNTSSLPFEERYKATLSKLQESMKRSQETRMSLKMKTSKTENYETRNLSGVLSSIEQSTEQLQDYLQSLRSTPANAA